MQDISLKREVCGGAYSTPVFRVINVFHRNAPQVLKGWLRIGWMVNILLVLTQ
jgi:hypothetical protein